MVGIEIAEWVKQELGGLRLGDVRRVERVKQMVTGLAAWSQAPIRRMFADKAAAKGFYRALEGQWLDGAAVTQAQQQATLVRIRERYSGEGLVVCVQDTTNINIGRFASMEGGGPLSDGKGRKRGIYVQTTLAVSGDGVPLGVLAQHSFARQEQGEKSRSEKAKERPHIAVEQKESNKWLRGLAESGVEQVNPATTVLFVSDQESDNFEYLTLPRPHNVHVLVRSQRNRLLDKRVARPGVRKQWEMVEAQPVAGLRRVPVRGRTDRPDRIAVCEVRFTQVIVPPPERLADDDNYQPLTAWMVAVREVASEPIPKAPPRAHAKPKADSKRTQSAKQDEPVKDEPVKDEPVKDEPVKDEPVKKGKKTKKDEPLNWRLLTTWPVTNVEEAYRLADCYALRWHVERFHYVLKSGCNVEKRRLGSVDNLKRFLSLANIVAWRLLWLTHAARQSPDAPCTVALSTAEWQTLVMAVKRSKTLPRQPPSLYQAVRWIAQLGGFLGYRSEGEPGVTVIWTGWMVLAHYVDMYNIFTSSNDAPSAPPPF